MSMVSHLTAFDERNRLHYHTWGCFSRFQRENIFKGTRIYSICTEGPYKTKQGSCLNANLPFGGVRHLIRRLLMRGIDRIIIHGGSGVAYDSLSR